MELLRGGVIMSELWIPAVEVESALADAFCRRCFMWSRQNQSR